MNLKKVLVGIAISLVSADAVVWAQETENQRSAVIGGSETAGHPQKRSEVIDDLNIPKDTPEKNEAISDGYNIPEQPVSTSPETPKNTSNMSANLGRYTEFVMATGPYVALLATTAMQPISAFTNYDFRLSRILGATSLSPMTDVLIVPGLDLLLTIQKERNQKLYPDTFFKTSGRATFLTMILSIWSAKSVWECVVGKSMATTFANRFFSTLLCGWTWYSATAKYKSFLENYLHYDITPVISAYYRSMMGKDLYAGY